MAGEIVGYLAAYVTEVGRVADQMRVSLVQAKHSEGGYHNGPDHNRDTVRMLRQIALAAPLVAAVCRGGLALPNGERLSVIGFEQKEVTGGPEQPFPLREEGIIHGAQESALYEGEFGAYVGDRAEEEAIVKGINLDSEEPKEVDPDTY